MSVGWSTDGKTLALGSSDKTMINWDSDSGKILKTLKVQTDNVTSIAWSPDGKTLASGGGDGTIRLWGLP